MTTSDYTPHLVERLLRSYLDIRSSLVDGSVSPAHDTSYSNEELQRRQQTQREQPLGYDGRPWPFHEVQHATPPRDGKSRARKVEELHCMCIDLEMALAQLGEYDRFLIWQYHITQNYTLKELCVNLGMSSEGSLQRRMQRIVARLTLILNRAQATKGSEDDI